MEATERRRAQCRQWNASRDHQSAAGKRRAEGFTREYQSQAGHNGFSAFSARFRASAGLPLLEAAHVRFLNTSALIRWGVAPGKVEELITVYRRMYGVSPEEATA